jgi:preprotein translocase subunit YajC
MTTSKVKKIRQRRRRQQKIRQLKQRLAETEDLKTRARLIAKIKKISIYPSKVNLEG